MPSGAEEGYAEMDAHRVALRFARSGSLPHYRVAYIVGNRREKTVSAATTMRAKPSR